MAPDEIFALLGPPAMLGWAILCLAPRRWPWLNAVPQLVIPLGLAGVYSVIMLSRFAEAGGGYGSLGEVRALFASDWMLLAGWAHYLAFDLMVGAYLAGRMDRLGIGRIVQVPILLATFLFGPVGVVLALVTEAGLKSPALLTRKTTYVGG